jgi:hypothetical protein
MNIVITITRNEKDNPPGKLADAELHFTDGELDGLKLIGFAIWEWRKRGDRGRSVTFPARRYAVNGERRSFALLRAVADRSAEDRIRELVLQTYLELERGCDWVTSS